MEENKKCKACGKDSFAVGELGHGHANIRPSNKMFAIGTPLLVTYCEHCGEVASLKVKELGKLKVW